MNLMRNKKSLLLLFPGPKYDLKEDLGGRLDLLSKYYKGLAITYSSNGGREEFGRFKVISEKIDDRASAIEKLCRLFALIKSNIYSVDAIICYDPLLTGLIGLYFSWKHNKKLIVEVNGLHHLASTYVDENLVTKMLTRFIYTKIMKFVIKRSDGVRLLYDRQLEELNIDLSSKVIAVYHDYTRLDEFKDLGEGKVILCAGFPLYLKGIDLLIAAFKNLSDKFPDWELHIIGWFEKPEILRKLVNSHPKISLLNAIPHRDMHKIMGSCGIYAMPSRSEGMGRVFLEAARCRKPRIGSNVGGIPSVINNGVDGLLVENESVIDLEDKLYKLLIDVDQRKRLGQAAYLRSLSDFSENSYISKTRSFYDKVLFGVSSKER